ncbi:MAG: HtaA domain-containing protein [Solirubrobacteraceae bacterium]|nr:HtaA domain-containing protein [Solirubrobacteraceae bacterium]
MPTAPSRGRARLALVLGTTLTAGAVVGPASAGATTVAGLGKLSADGAAYRSLARQGVKLEPSGDAAVTKTAGVTTFLLPTTDVDFAATTRTKLGGSMVLRRKSGGKTRTVRLESLQLRLGKAAASRALSAKVGGKRIDVLRLDLRKGEYTVDAKSLAVKVGGTRASLTKAAATAIGAKLALRTRTRGAFGVLSIATSARVAGPSTPAAGTGTTTPGTGAGTGTTPGTGGSTGVNTSPTACTTTLPGTTKNTDGTPYVAPVPLARPAGAVDVISSTLRWHPRESFIRYITGGGEGVTPSAGATGGPATADGKVDVDFTPAAGSWYDRASGQGRLLFSGCVTFSYKGHGINLQVSNPQIELNGSSSRMLATLTGATSADFTGLGELTALELVSGGGQTSGSTPTLVVRTAVPTHLTAWANDVVLGGFYPAPDDSFGQITVTAGLPA